MRHLILSLLLLMPIVASGQEILVEGEYVLSVRKLPLKLHAPAPDPVEAAAQEKLVLVDWYVPSVVSANEESGTLEVLTLPKGDTTIRVKIRVIDFKTKQMEQSYFSRTLSYGGDVNPPPGPEETDCENCPPDDMGLGKMICQWVLEMPVEHRARANKVAAIYAEAALKLESEATWDITHAGTFVRGEIEKVPIASPAEAESWRAFGSKITSDWTNRWPMSRAKVVAYYKALATGLNHAAPKASVLKLSSRR